MAEPFLGEIRICGFNFPPRGWALCDGQILPINQNQALFSLLGTTYGGDGRTTFGLPDLRGRVPMGPRNGPGLSDRRLGEKGGTETNTLTASQLPAHTHPLLGHGAAGNANTVPGNSLSNDAGVSSATYSSVAPSAPIHAASIGNSTGGGTAVNNVQPFLAVNFIIALVGVFPSRN